MSAAGTRRQAAQGAAPAEAQWRTCFRCARSPVWLLGVDLTQIHGLGPSLALKLIAECGTDLKAWPSAKHFTSWLCLAPGNKISGGKVLSSRTPEIIEPRSRPPTAGGDHDRAQRHRAGRLLPPTIIARRQGKGGHGDRPQDRRSVLQHSSLRHELSRSRCRPPMRSDIEGASSLISSVGPRTLGYVLAANTGTPRGLFLRKAAAFFAREAT